MRTSRYLSLPISLRTALTAGVCGVTVGAITLAPSIPLARTLSTPAFSFSAYSLDPAGGAPAGTSIPPAEARDMIEFIESIAAPSRSAPTTAPAIDPGTPPALAGGQPGTVPRAWSPSAVDVEPMNAASNIIDAVYSVSRFWANYMSLDLGPWLINWIPFGYLISDQIYIWYPTFVLPVVDSFVYQFLDPVVNNPLDLETWWNGLVAIADTAINGVVSGISQEIDYLFSLSWLPFPLPPLPWNALAAVAAADTAGEAELRMALVAAATDMPAPDPVAPQADPALQAAPPGALPAEGTPTDAPTAEAPDVTSEPEADAEPAETPQAAPSAEPAPAPATGSGAGSAAELGPAEPAAEGDGTPTPPDEAADVAGTGDTGEPVPDDTAEDAVGAEDGSEVTDNDLTGQDGADAPTGGTGSAADGDANDGDTAANPPAESGGAGPDASAN